MKMLESQVGAPQPIDVKCTCGFHLTGQANSLLRYCGGCGAPFDARTPVPCSRLQVLVVEDSKTLRTAIATTIRKMDCQVREARDGQEALDLICARPPDLVVTDLLMPRMTGIELLSALRGDPRHREIPVTVLTSVGDSGTLRDVMDQGVLAYVIKNEVDREQLRQRLQQCIEAARTLMQRRHRRKVLVVEDSMLRKALAQMLSKLGCEVLEAQDGTEALVMLRKDPPDLVISDIEMPRMNGLELLEAMRGDDRFRETPVVMLTTRKDAQTMGRAIAAGVIAYLVKDQLTPQDLRQQLEQCLCVSTSPVSSSAPP